MCSSRMAPKYLDKKRQITTRQHIHPSAQVFAEVRRKHAAGTGDDPSRGDDGSPAACCSPWGDWDASRLPTPAQVSQKPEKRITSCGVRPTMQLCQAMLVAARRLAATNFSMSSPTKLDKLGGTSQACRPSKQS